MAGLSAARACSAQQSDATRVTGWSMGLLVCAFDRGTSWARYVAKELRAAKPEGTSPVAQPSRALGKYTKSFYFERASWRGVSVDSKPQPCCPDAADSASMRAQRSGQRRRAHDGQLAQAT